MHADEIVAYVDAKVYEVNNAIDRGVGNFETRINRLECDYDDMFDALQHLKYLSDSLEDNFANYVNKICAGLNKVFKQHFENENFEISEVEFMKVINDAKLNTREVEIELPF